MSYKHTHQGEFSLSNLFNALDRRSALRITVYTTLLDLASANDELDILQINKAEVERWLSEWDIPQEDKSAFLKRIADAFSKADEPYETPLSALFLHTI
jgi:translation initiation factor 3 subunit M